MIRNNLQRVRQSNSSKNRAVSSVIGVILMVAITVILSAVIATFVLGLGESVSSSAPQATFDFEHDKTVGEVTITHAGGATLERSAVTIQGYSGSLTDWGSTEISAGTTATVGVSPGDEIRITWQNDAGTESATLQTYEVDS